MADPVATAAAAATAAVAPATDATPKGFRAHLDAQPTVADEPAAPDASVAGTEDPAPDMAAETQEPTETEGDSVSEFEQILGMKEEDFLASLRDDGVLPDDVIEKLKIRRTRDGVEEIVPLNEHRDDVLRHSDYSRKLNDLRAERHEFQRTQDSFAGMIDGWKAKPETMADDLELLGIDLEAVLAPVAQIYAAEADMTPRERELSRRAREAERQARMIRLRQKADQQRIEGDRRAAQAARLEEHIGRFRGEAFKMHKIPDSKPARKLFEDHLRSFWHTGPLTPGIANEAAKATHADLVQMAIEHQAAQGGANAPPRAPAASAAPVAPVAARPPPPRGAAPGGAPAAHTQTGGTVSDFRKFIEERRERGRS